MRWIGPLFLANAAALVVTIAGLAQPRTRQFAALAGVVISALALASLVISYGNGLFGWQEAGFRTPVALAMIIEAGAVILLATALTLESAFGAARRRAGDVTDGSSGSVTAIVVPSPGGLFTTSAPLSAAARSCRPSSPVPASVRAPPTPSSCTSTCSSPSWTTALTRALEAPACLTVFVSASATMKYAVASTSGGSRSVVTSSLTGRRIRADQRVERCLEPSAQRRGEDPVGEIAQLRVGALGMLERLVEELDRRPGGIAEAAPRELQRDERVHEALLGSVVQVALEASARLVGSGDDACAGGGELGAALARWRSRWPPAR